MTALAQPRQVRVLADTFTASSKQRALILNVALIAAGALIVGAFAQIEVPLWPVSITGQTLAVIVVGAALGAKRGAAALTTYMLGGLAGIPWFAGFTGGPLAVLKPSFGFVIGFIGAAWVAGWFAERAWDRKPLMGMVGFTLASVVPFLVGVPYMAYIVNVYLGNGLSFGQILEAGVTPFIIGGLIKAALAAVLIPLAWKGVQKLEQR